MNARSILPGYRSHRAAGLCTAVLLIGLPLLGLYVAGRACAPYFEFPPRSRFVTHADFSLPVSLGMALFVVAVAAPFIRRARTGRKCTPPAPPRPGHWPWWGSAGAVLGAVAWVLAWTRQDWFAPLQHHTFTPLWVAYILCVNALTLRRSGTCMLTGSPRLFLTLIPCSALFWWFFEYLNRFVQNWYYVAIEHFDATEYALTASLSFATVLPAVLGTRDLLLTFPGLRHPFRNWAPVPARGLKGAAAMVLACAGAGLAGIAVWPDALFPLLWIAPLLILVSLQVLTGCDHVFADTLRGDWSGIVAAALAALVCGLCWEMWNYYSLAKWVYSVPYVDRLHIFEMPLLGYAGYLPFGLECAAIGRLLRKPPTGNARS